MKSYKFLNNIRAVVLSAVAAANEAAIAGKVLADKIEQDVSLANEKEWDINGEKVTIGVQKI